MNQNKDIAFQQYLKICGAIEMVQAMQKAVLDHEKEESEKLADEEKGEVEPVPEHSEAA